MSGHIVYAQTLFEMGRADDSGRSEQRWPSIPKSHRLSVTSPGTQATSTRPGNGISACWRLIRGTKKSST
jgi:hypothetical protein